MTSRVKMTILVAIIAAVFIAVFAYMSSRNLYKNPAEKGTFVFERLEEDDPWMFI